MDVVALLEQAAAELPPGDYSLGLDAITRHVKAAIRHLERNSVDDPDSCTDAIYRTNQAYEGSLKEAYRVLAGQDPSGETPFKIENYLTTHSVVRPRVLTQLTRYRQDYRNPSTHDYKLDFDSDEALLAILSVCGFAKLLINQIKSKLASNAAQERVARSGAGSVAQDSMSDSERIARLCLSYTNESVGVAWFDFERGIADLLNQEGFSSELKLSSYEELENSSDREIAMWDIIAHLDSGFMGIDVRVARADRIVSNPTNYKRYSVKAIHDGASEALLISRSRSRTGYSLYLVADTPITLYFIIEDADTDEIKRAQQEFGRMDRIA